MQTNKVDLSALATVHVAGQTITKRTLFNAVCDVDGTEFGAPTVIDVRGRCFTTRDIEDIRRSPEFQEHCQALAAEGKDRD
jgi:hypothetical protein